jgi:pimeloyl-ACP methyl ester carboxylesterase
MSGRQRKQLELTMSDGQAVRGECSFVPGAANTPAVIFAHGFGSVRGGEKGQALADECARRGWAFAACDFRAHGESDGTMLELRGSRLLEDLEAVVAEIGDYTSGPVCLVGSSMGGWAAAWLAALQPQLVAACVLVAPAFRFLEFDRLSAPERAAWQQTGRHRVRNEFVDVEVSYGLTEEAAAFKFETLTRNFRTPALIWHGMRDESVPYQTSLEFAARCAAADVQLLLLKDGDHRLTRAKAQLAAAACDFFAARS